MITLLLYCFLNGFLFHFDPDIMTVMENRIMMLARCDRTTANLIANEVLDLERDAYRELPAYKF